MENYKRIISEAVLKAEENEVEINYLNKYFELINKYGFLDLANGKETCNKFYQELRDNYQYPNKWAPQILDIEFSSLITLIQAVFTLTEVEHKIYALILIQILDVEDILIGYILEHSLYDDCESNLIKYLSNFQGDIHVDGVSELHHEFDLATQYKDGLKSFDIKKIYQFVDGVERSGRLFHLGNLAPLIVKILYKINFDELVSKYNSIQDPLTLNILSQHLSDSQKIKLASCSSNKLVQFNSIRSLVYFSKLENELKASESDYLIKILINLTKEEHVWTQFLDYFLEYPSRAPKLFVPLGKLLGDIHKDRQVQLIDKIKLSNYESEEAIKLLFDMVMNIGNEDSRTFIIKEIYNRWIDFVKSYDGNLHNIIKTDVFYIVLTYTEQYMHCDVKNDLINSVLNKITSIDNYWFKSQCDQRNYYYRQLSIVFMHSYGYVKNNQKDLLSKIKNVLENNYWYKFEKHFDTGKKSSDKLFEEYIFNSTRGCDGVN